MWLASLLTTSAGVTTLGLGAVQSNEWDTLENRRRIRYGAASVAVGTAASFATLLADRSFAGSPQFSLFGLLVVTSILLSALLALRFGYLRSAKAVESQQEVRTRLARRTVRPVSTRGPARLLAHSHDEVDDEEDAPTGVSFSEAQRQAAQVVLMQKPRPRRVTYQPPMA